MFPQGSKWMFNLCCYGEPFIVGVPFNKTLNGDNPTLSVDREMVVKPRDLPTSVAADIQCPEQRSLLESVYITGL